MRCVGIGRGMLTDTSGGADAADQIRASRDAEAGCWKTHASNRKGQIPDQSGCSITVRMLQIMQAGPNHARCSRSCKVLQTRPSTQVTLQIPRKLGRTCSTASCCTGFSGSREEGPPPDRSTTRAMAAQRATWRRNALPRPLRALTHARTQVCKQACGCSMQACELACLTPEHVCTLARYVRSVRSVRSVCARAAICHNNTHSPA